MNIIEDTGQKIGLHEIKNNWFNSNNHKITRCHLPCGDYALFPTISVDTKQNMEEIATNLCSTKAEHVRVRNEMLLAQRNNCKLIFLVENENGISDISQVHTWEDKRNIKNKKHKPVDAERLQKTMLTMESKYGCKFLFCHPNESAYTIIKLLKGEF